MEATLQTTSRKTLIWKRKYPQRFVPIPQVCAGAFLGPLHDRMGDQAPTFPIGTQTSVDSGPVEFQGPIPRPSMDRVQGGLRFSHPKPTRDSPHISAAKPRHLRKKPDPLIYQLASKRGLPRELTAKQPMDCSEVAMNTLLQCIY